LSKQSTVRPEIAKFESNKNSGGIILLALREQSSMVSTWEEHLGLERLSENTWRIGTFGYEWIGSVYDLVPEDQLYSEDGEFEIPEFWDGKKIIGLADGEYLQTDELIAADEVDFESSELHKPLDFCKSRGWTEIPQFDSVWQTILDILSRSSNK